MDNGVKFHQIKIGTTVSRGWGSGYRTGDLGWTGRKAWPSAITLYRPVRWKEETKRKLFAMGLGVVDQRAVPMARLRTQEDTHRAEGGGAAGSRKHGCMEG